jgi:hypothetical protein
MYSNIISNFEFLISNEIRMIECLKISSLKIYSKFKIRSSEFFDFPCVCQWLM